MTFGRERDSARGKVCEGVCAGGDIPRGVFTAGDNCSGVTSTDWKTLECWVSSTKVVETGDEVGPGGDDAP